MKENHQIVSWVWEMSGKLLIIDDSNCRREFLIPVVVGVDSGRELFTMPNRLELANFSQEISIYTWAVINPLLMYGENHQKSQTHLLIVKQLCSICLFRNFLKVKISQKRFSASTSESAAVGVKWKMRVKSSTTRLSEIEVEIFSCAKSQKIFEPVLILELQHCRRLRTTNSEHKKGRPEKCATRNSREWEHEKMLVKNLKIDRFQWRNEMIQIKPFGCIIFIIGKTEFCSFSLLNSFQFQAERRK